jgi:hypothetical protein
MDNLFQDRTLFPLTSDLSPPSQGLVPVVLRNVRRVFAHTTDFIFSRMAYTFFVKCGQSPESSAASLPGLRLASDSEWLDFALTPRNQCLA